MKSPAPWRERVGEPLLAEPADHADHDRGDDEQRGQLGNHQPSSHEYGAASGPVMICDHGMIEKIMNANVRTTETRTILCLRVSGGGSAAEVSARLLAVAGQEARPATAPGPP